MSNLSALPGARQDPAWTLKGMVLPGLLYPFWYWLGPRAANDPWLVWWIVGLGSAAVGVLPTLSRGVREHLPTLYYATLWAVALHIYTLAALNQMQPFYAVGSVMTTVMAGAVIRTKPALVAYAVFVVVLGLVLFAWDPDPRKIAYWGPAPLVLALFYFRLKLLTREEELAKHHRDELENRVAERTRELSSVNERLHTQILEREQLEEQLRLSQKMEAVGRLAGGVAHDFNNLITAIRGYGDLVMAELAPGSPLRDDVEQIVLAGDQAAELTSQLLTFSRKQPVESQAVELNGVILEMSSMLRTVVGTGIEVVTSLEPGLEAIRSDRTSLQRCILNLVLNARDAMPRGGMLRIETRSLSPGQVKSSEPVIGHAGDRYVGLSVTDTGEGMDPATLSRIFDPFFTTRRPDQGSGLGLSTTYGAVKQVGGHIHVSSAPGRGACFELAWPAAGEASDEIDPAPRARPGDGRNERILLVEDQESLRRLFRRVLRAHGYAVRALRDAESALSLVAEKDRDFDLLVTDVVMPGMSGLELAERVMALRPGLRVLFVSGHLEHPSLRAGDLPAGTTLVRKPVSTTDLCAAVRDALDGRSPTDRSPVDDLRRSAPASTG